MAYTFDNYHHLGMENYDGGNGRWDFNHDGEMRTITLIIGFFGLMFGLVGAVFYGIVVITGALFAALIGMLTKVIENGQSQNN